jgi:hypothetical protein
MDKALKEHFLSTFVKEQRQHIIPLDQINVFLPKEEHLILMAKENMKNKVKDPSIVLSEKQLQVLSKRMEFINTLNGKKVLVRRKLLSLLRFIKNK